MKTIWKYTVGADAFKVEMQRQIVYTILGHSNITILYSTYLKGRTKNELLDLLER